MIDWLQRHILTLVGVAVVVGLGVVVAQRVVEEQSDGGGRRGGGETPVVVSEVVRAPFLDTLQAVGSATANESVEITASVSDRVRAMSLSEGTFVRAGDVLVELDTTEEEAELAEARANLDDQRRQFERLDSLVSTNAAALSQRDEQRARMEAAEARVDVIRARIADRIIRAPFDGLLGLRRVSPGALVSPGDPITTLDDIQPIKLDFSVPENVLAVLREGATLRARSVAYPDQLFEGVVAHLSPRVDPVTRSIAIRAELPNTDRLLRPGMLMVVDLVRDRRMGLMIPEGALIPEGERQYVFRVDEGVVQRIEVGIGARRPGLVEITRGLDAGDIVVVEGGLRLRPGAPVREQSRIDALALLPEADRRAMEDVPAASVAAEPPGTTAGFIRVGSEFGG